MNCHSLLLIDDNPHDIELTLSALGEEADQNVDQEVKVVMSGREALEYLAACPEGAPDLILLDLNMPHMNGLEVLDALRAQEQTRDVPVVVLTTSDEERDRRQSYEHGASDFVVKALDLTQFCEAMGRVRRFWRTLRHSARAGLT